MSYGENWGYISEINGSVLKVKGFSNPSVGYLVEIDENLRLIGEILKIERNIAIVQCYEDTLGLELYSKVFNTQEPLSVELGPGLLKSIFDGIQRPLDRFYNQTGDFIKKGAKIDPLNRNKSWDFIPKIKINEKVNPGDIIGLVHEESIDHYILVPPNISGKISFIHNGFLKGNDHAYSIKTDSNNIQDFNLITKWPIRTARPYTKRLLPKIPLITGTRVIDLLFPIPQGGVASIAGGFGTGKTITLQSLAKYANADIIIYIGCGERGNEIADFLTTFSKLRDPRKNELLINRTVMVANTSNMPVSAREASIFSGITMAEYFRDMGYNVLLLADSTSRWAEALRELSGRLEEMPIEGGYPAYLADRLSSFYERAGVVRTLGKDYRIGSITTIGAVSPPGGDFSEPITSTTKRFVKTFWALDPKLAYSRHYPSINPNNSYSLYEDLAEFWITKIDKNWNKIQATTKSILEKASKLENIAKIVGIDTLPQDQKLAIYTSELIKQSFLIQNQYNENDKYSSPNKTMAIIKGILEFYRNSKDVITEGIPFYEVVNLKVLNKLKRARLDYSSLEIENLKQITFNIKNEFNNLKKSHIFVSSRGR